MMDKKKHISKKETLQLITERIEKGESKNEIYNVLSSEYYDSELIAKLTAIFPDKELKEQFIGINKVLFYLLIVTAILKVLSVFPLLIEKPAIGFFVMLIVPILNIWFASEVKKTRGHIYRILGLLAIAGIFNSLGQIQEIGIWVLFDIILLAIISGISFYIGKKMFPNYGFSGPKKDSSGNWMF
jgi:hypothetical protein